MNKIKLVEQMSLNELSTLLNIGIEELAMICIDIEIKLEETKILNKYSLEILSTHLGIEVEFYDPDPNSQLNVFVEKGNASKKEIADIISDISVLYRKIGGSGINFSFEGIHIRSESHVEL